MLPVRVIAVALSLACPGAVQTANFTTGRETAARYGVHEIVLSGSEQPGNPFDTLCTVRFTPPSGEGAAIEVKAFYDGGGLWRARVYVTETGRWSWRSQAPNHPELDQKSGSFLAADSHLPGRLRRHPNNPKHWIREDGQWFLNLNDTAYFLFNAGMPQWQKYIEEDWRRGITSLRVGALGGHDWDRVTSFTYSNYPWDGDDKTRFDLRKFHTTDVRLKWMLDHYPGMYLQFILFGLKQWAKDNTGEEWFALPPAVRTRTMDYMIARWAAFPQLFWLIVNDMHCDENFPNNQRFTREVGRYFAAHDSWKHPLSVGPKRSMPFPFTTPQDDWVGYIHLEGLFEVGADWIRDFDATPVPVSLGEDRYEQDRHTRDPLHPRYFYRWLFWSWLLSGGSVSYGGRFRTITPYSETASIPYDSGWKGEDAHVYTARLEGLDDTAAIQRFFADRSLELWRFQPDDGLAQDAEATGRRRPKLMRAAHEEYLIYHPNARSEGRSADLDPERTPRFRVNLASARGSFLGEWFRPLDGASQKLRPVSAGDWVEFVSPWKGVDVVLYLWSERKER